MQTAEKVAILIGIAWNWISRINVGFAFALVWYWLSKLLVKALLIISGSLIVDWCLRKIGFDLPRWWLF